MKHRPYNEDPNAGLTLTYGKYYLEHLAKQYEPKPKRTRESIRAERAKKAAIRAGRKVERNRKKMGGGNG